MRHAKNITYGELEVGTEFTFTAHVFEDGEFKYVEKSGVITSLRTTKKGRIGIEVNGETWQQTFAPTSFVQV